MEDYNAGVTETNMQEFCESYFRPWHDAQAIARARAITRANQEKGGLGGR